MKVTLLFTPLQHQCSLIVRPDAIAKQAFSAVGLFFGGRMAKVDEVGQGRITSCYRWRQPVCAALSISVSKYQTWTATISITRKTLRPSTSRTRATLTGWMVRPEKGTRGSRVRRARIYRTELLPNLLPDKAKALRLDLRRCRRPALLQRHLLGQPRLWIQRAM